MSMMAVDAHPSSSTPAPWPQGSLTTLLAGSASHALAEGVERALGTPFGACTTERFPDGEVMVRLDESVRGHEVVLLQATSYPVNDHLVELLALTDACRRAAASRIVALIPYFGYARSDRRDGRRAPITARLVATMLETAGVNHVLTVDAHTPALEGFFSIPMDNISAASVLAEAVRPELQQETVIVSPDLGAVKLANRYAVALGTSVAVCHKQRSGPETVSVSRITGDVSGRRCVIVDDMIATGSTIVEAARALRDAGANHEIAVIATHGVFVSGSLAKLMAAGVRRIWVTDTIPVTPTATKKMSMEVVSIAPLLATALQRVLQGGSVRDLA